MGRGPCTFKEADIARAARVAKKIGGEVVIDHERKLIRIIPAKSDAGNGTPAAEKNEWDEVLSDEKNAEIR
jgi:hypothetical protein